MQSLTKLACIKLFCLFMCLSTTITNVYSQTLDLMASPKITITDWVEPNRGIDLKGKYIVIDFWATWCAPCLAALPHLNGIEQRFRDNHELIFLSISDEKPEIIKKILPKFHFTSLVVSDTTSATLKSFHIRALPSVCLIDKLGILKWVGTPEELNEDLVLKVINEEHIATLNKNTTSDDSVDSLSKKYNQIFSDSARKNYFDCSISETEGDSKSMSRNGNGTYNKVQMHIEIPLLFATLLNCSIAQINLPDRLMNKKISFCYKQTGLLNPIYADTILLNKIMERLNLKSKVSLQEKLIYSLTVINSHKLSESIVNQNGRLVKEGFSISSDNRVITIHNSPLTALVIALREVLGADVQLGPKFNLESRYDLDISNISASDLSKSLSAYGILLQSKVSKIRVFNFE